MSVEKGPAIIWTHRGRHKSHIFSAPIGDADTPYIREDLVKPLLEALKEILEGGWLDDESACRPDGSSPVSDEAQAALEAYRKAVEQGE